MQKSVYEKWHADHLESLHNDLYYAQDGLRDAWSSLPESDGRVKVLRLLRRRALDLLYDIEKYREEHVER